MTAAGTPRAAAPPRRVDRYDLCDVIATGGMATVYFARQRGAAGFRKVVAIKRMRPDLVHEREFVELFMDEARLASRVRHANVVSVTDVVLSGDELLLVMDYVHGASLASLLDASRRAGELVPADVAIAILVDVLHGLHAAHEARSERGEPLGIVHRDVSPQNVLVGVDGVARVVDFGVARAAGQLHRTEEGKTRGKAAYSAPEQLRGAALDRTIDLFAASAMLWEVLVGRRLFEGTTQAAVVTSVLTQPIEPPGLHRPELPETLDETLMRGLDRDPRRRPQTALELANALAVAIPPAGPPAVIAWMTKLARAELEKREAVVRRIESSGDTEEASEAPATTPEVPRRRSRLVPAAAVALLLGAALGLVGVAFRAPPLAVLAPRPRLPLPRLPTPTASPEGPPSVAASRTASPAGRPKAAPRASAPAGSARRCDPPYDLDAAGRKIFRVECL